MNIIGPDLLIFGVDDVEACKQFALDYGLTQTSEHRFVALDGTGIEIYSKDDSSLPAPLETGSNIRKTIYGVADTATVDAIYDELSKDREVKRLDDGSIEAVDDMGFVLGFQVTMRKPLDMPAEKINAPGAPAQRPANEVGVSKDLRRSRALCLTWCTSCRITKKRKRFTQNVWALSPPTASVMWGLSCVLQALPTTIRCSS